MVPRRVQHKTQMSWSSDPHPSLQLISHCVNNTHPKFGLKPHWPWLWVPLPTVLTCFSHTLVPWLWIPHPPLSTWQHLSSKCSSSEVVFCTKLFLNEPSTVCSLLFLHGSPVPRSTLILTHSKICTAIVPMCLFLNRHWTSWRMGLCDFCLCFLRLYLRISRW